MRSPKHVSIAMDGDIPTAIAVVISVSVPTTVKSHAFTAEPMTTPLTKERINALEGYLSAPDIALPSEEQEALKIAADLIAYWKSQQPKPRCKYCGRTERRHVSGHCRSNDEFKEILITRFHP